MNKCYKIIETNDFLNHEIIFFKHDLKDRPKGEPEIILTELISKGVEFDYSKFF